jgi:hypothetical protein
MLGLMQEWPLLCHKIIDHAARQHGHREIVSRSVEGPIVRTTYTELRKRALRVRSAGARRLRPRRPRRDAGLEHRAPSGGLVRHHGHRRGLSHAQPAAFPEQIAWIMNHAEDRILFVDLTFMPLVEKLAPIREVPEEGHRAYRRRAHAADRACPTPSPTRSGWPEADGDFVWKSFDENTPAGMCYTSGTTGDPKGVLYSHRSNVLHAMMAACPTPWASRRATSSCRSCRCSMPMPGGSARQADDRRQDGDAGRQDGRRLDLRTARHREGHLLRGRADGLADAAPASGGDREAAAASQARGHRRLGLPARHHAEVPAELRCRGHPRLGHDRDVAARLALHVEAGIRGS